jgi:hypothetical protein
MWSVRTRCRSNSRLTESGSDITFRPPWTATSNTPGFGQGHYLAANDRLIWQRPKRLYDGRISEVEVIVVSELQQVAGLHFQEKTLDLDLLIAHEAL